MRLLALQPYDAASHRALLDGWQRHSRHDFEVLALPGRHFKWRMRQAPLAFAEQTEQLIFRKQRFDALWCTSMLDLATYLGLCPSAAALPTAVYFHENQLTYPVRYKNQRDLHFGLTNMTTALAAIALQPGGIDTNRPPACVWWNSAYNRDSFLSALGELVEQVPDHPPRRSVQAIADASEVIYPGIDLIEPTTAAQPKRTEPPVLLWAARWEYDKRPALFFEALDELDRRGVAFRLSVIGEQFAEYPKCFDAAHQRFGDRVVRWGYQLDRADYVAALREAAIVVSTSQHEFFGIAVAEAVSAGCVPVLPDALAYPEVWGDSAVYHDQGAKSVADAIERAIALPFNRDFAHAAERFAWPRVAAQMDDAIEALVEAAR